MGGFFGRCAHPGGGGRPQWTEVWGHTACDPDRTTACLPHLPALSLEFVASLGQAWETAWEPWTWLVRPEISQPSPSFSNSQALLEMEFCDKKSAGQVLLGSSGQLGCFSHPADLRSGKSSSTSQDPGEGSFKGRGAVV